MWLNTNFPLKFFPGSLIIFLFTACVPADDNNSITTIILVRHAEKALNNAEDPPLNKKGELRARTLAHKLAATHINAIYSTPYKRTENTVSPVASQKNIPIKHYDPEKDLTQFINELLADHPGETVLISGHSSTVPGMLNVLSGTNKYENLQKNDYNDIFIATTIKNGPSQILHLNYVDSLIFNQEKVKE